MVGWWIPDARCGIGARSRLAGMVLLWLGLGAFLPTSEARAQDVRVTGTVGDTPVDLTITGWQVFAPGTPAGAPVPVSARPRPPLPKITGPVMFNTPEADRILEAMQVFPPDNPWNEDISQLPVHPNNANLLASTDPDHWLWFNLDMCFILVPPDQKRVPLKLVSYAGESDPGPYPVPDNAPIEGWPLYGADLDRVQREGEGDRHCLVVDPVKAMLYEFFVIRKTDEGWQAACEASFDLKSNQLRPDGWTSADAAGLPIFPAVVRYDECERGMVEHAMRVTFSRTRREYAYPATHFASRSDDPNLPGMGYRLRLKRDFDTTGFAPHVQAILKGMKKYGMFVADNGMNWLISIAPDTRLKGLEELKRLKGTDFEFVQTTGPNEGPRARP